MNSRNGNIAQLLLLYTFIIFGWGNTKTKDRGEAYPMHCSNCRNDVYYHFVKISTRFTLFFIPLIPYSRDYLLSCPVCNASIELDRDDRGLVKEFTDTTQKFLDGEMDSEQYEHELADFTDEASFLQQEEEMEV